MSYTDHAEQAEAEAAAAFIHARNSEDFDICKQCGILRPCPCDEKTVNAMFPWPEDPAAITESEAKVLCAERGKLRQSMKTADAEALANKFLGTRDTARLTNKQAAWMRDVLNKSVEGGYRGEIVYTPSVTIDPIRLGSLNSFSLRRAA